ncbi:MAG TPA: hypothetical protein VG433_17350, partial [Pirellulales bacterium]|nr:hypothetical protein [Pirellulales bacterium]
MPIYHHLGELPRKRHTVFRRPDGALYSEHLVGSRGFSGPASLLYHLRPPTAVLGSRLAKKLSWHADPDPLLRMRHFRLTKMPATSSITLDRVPLLYNHDVALSLSRPTEADDYFYRNAEGDELVYVSDGVGVLESQMGELEYGPGDYVIIP